MFIDPMKSFGKIGESKTVGIFYIRTFKLYREKILAIGEDYIARCFLKTWIRSIAQDFKDTSAKG
jgi:hypothetical protein